MKRAPGHGADRGVGGRGRPEERRALDAGWPRGWRPCGDGLSPLPTSQWHGPAGSPPALTHTEAGADGCLGSCSDPPTGSGRSQRHPNATPGAQESREGCVGPLQGSPRGVCLRLHLQAKIGGLVLLPSSGDVHRDPCFHANLWRVVRVMLGGWASGLHVPFSGSFPGPTAPSKCPQSSLPEPGGQRAG